MEKQNQEKREKSAQHRRKKLLEQSKLHEAYVEQEWSSMNTLEASLKEIEKNAAKEDGRKQKKKTKGGKGSNASKGRGEEAEQVENKNKSKTESPDEHNRQDAANEEDEEDDDEDEDVGYFCEVCNKLFKTVNAFKNHESSKKHKANVLRFKEELDDEEEEEVVD